MSVSQETCLQGFAKLSLGKLIPDLKNPSLILLNIPFPGVQVSRNRRNEENRQKPETKLTYCWWGFADYCRPSIINWMAVGLEYGRSVFYAEQTTRRLEYNLARFGKRQAIKAAVLKWTQTENSHFSTPKVFKNSWVFLPFTPSPRQLTASIRHRYHESQFCRHYYCRPCCQRIRQTVWLL